jgi:para-aminobenzoate synthetase / 4-amino-4-deoxychorismate lyase
MAAVFDQRPPDPQQGVFETLLVLHGRPVELDAHLARLDASLVALFPDRPKPDLGEDVPGVSGQYRGITPGTSGEHGPGALRITVAPGGDGGLEVQTSLQTIGRGLAFEPQPVALHSFPLAGGLGAHKWADRSQLDAAQARLPTETLPLLVDSDGTVLEASRANVFAVRDQTLVTPPTDGRILPGITRMRVLEIAAVTGLDTLEVELTRDDLLAADEVFLTGSVRGIEPVRSLDGTELATGGEISSNLAAELRRTWAAVEVG